VIGPVQPAPTPDISATRPITEIERGTFTFPELGVSVSNEFDGGRFSDAWAEGDSVLVLHNRPENAPINNSAWYAFELWSEVPDTLTVRLTYEDGRHRYFPKVRRSGDQRWKPLDSTLVHLDPQTRSATLRIPVGPDKLRVAGQEMRTSSYFEEWTAELVEREGTNRREFATSPPITRCRTNRRLGVTGWSHGTGPIASSGPREWCTRWVTTPTRP
jgi:hypothetical protein